MQLWDAAPGGGLALLMAANVRGPGVSGLSAEPRTQGEGTFLTPRPGFPRASFPELNPRLLKTLMWFLLLAQNLNSYRCQLQK